MALKTNTFAAATAVAAAFSLLATPAAAVDLPKPAAVKAYDGDGWNAERDRRRRWRRHDNGIDAGDVVAGVLVIGAIAAIAGAARDRREQERYEERLPRSREEDYGYRTPGAYERSDSRGIDNAVDICVTEVERGEDRVGSVDSATRTPEGWRVSGELENGNAWSCAIGNDGRISDLKLGTYGYGTAPAERVEDGQWSDEAYMRARENQRPAGGEVDADLGG